MGQDRDSEGRYLQQADSLVTKTIRIRPSTLSLLEVQAQAGGVPLVAHLRQILEAAAGQPCSRESL